MGAKASDTAPAHQHGQAGGSDPAAATMEEPLPAPTVATGAPNANTSTRATAANQEAGAP